jgi:hypothetical protein
LPRRRNRAVLVGCTPSTLRAKTYLVQRQCSPSGSGAFGPASPASRSRRLHGTVAVPDIGAQARILAQERTVDLVTCGSSHVYQECPPNTQTLCQPTVSAPFQCERKGRRDLRGGRADSAGRHSPGRPVPGRRALILRQSGTGAGLAR